MFAKAARKNKLRQVRIHTKNSQVILDFLARNKKTFQVEQTVSGFATYNYGNKAICVRDKTLGKGGMSKILMFQNDVVKSDLYKFCNRFTVNTLIDEATEIERTLMYSGYTFNPRTEKSFKQVIKIDLNTAYWQTCRHFGIISAETYKEIKNTTAKPTRLKITGTLGRKSYLTDYVEGVRMGASYLKQQKKKRIIFQNLYNRVRKFVDELMIWCYFQNPSNFIGYYVDCLWLREYDEALIEKLKSIYSIKMEIVDMDVFMNAHGKVQVIERAEFEDKPYTAKFKNPQFEIYKKFFNFTPDLKDINLKLIWR